LGEGLDEAESAPGVHRGIADGIKEAFSRDVMRTGPGGEDAARFEEFQGAEMDLLVAAEGVAKVLLAAGEGRRIEDDEVETIFARLEEVEGIGFDGWEVELVEAGIGMDGHDGVGGDVDAGDGGCPGAGARQSESALVAEAVEDAAPCGEACDALVGVELIEVEAGFLAGERVDLEFQSVVVDHERARVGAVEHGEFGAESFGFADGGVVAEDDGGGLESFAESLDEEVAALVHGEREGLQDEVVEVAVDDDAGQAVGFAPDEAAEAGIDGEALAEGGGLVEAAEEELAVEGLAAAGEAAGDDLGGGVVDGGAEEAVPSVLERDDFAGLGVSEGLEDFAGVDPLVAVKDAGAGFDDESGHGRKTGGRRDLA